jgi:predicted nucleic acid-binding protein
LGPDLPAETLILDASALVPLVANEGHSVAVRALLASNVFVVAPDFILAELANVLWLKVRRCIMGKDEVAEAFAVAAQRIDQCLPTPPLIKAAFALALKNDHPAYDAIYVALAQREKLPLVTGDRRLAVAFEGIIEIRLLGPSTPAAPPPPAPPRSSGRSRKR